MNDPTIPANVRGAGLLTTAWACAGLAIAIVATRFYVRLRIVEKVSLNDWLILLTLVLAIILSSFCSVSVHWGLGQHERHLDPKQRKDAIKWLYLTEFFAIMTPNFGRISFALLLLELIPPQRWRRNFLWILIGLQFVVDVVTVIITYAQCRPVKGFWDHTVGAKCWPPDVQANTGYFQGSFCALVDLILAVFPASLFWNLNMKMSARISLSVLMGLGIFSMAASIAKTISLKNVSAEDQTYGMAALAICFTLEAYTVLIAASLPTLRPLMFHAQKGSSRAGYSGGGNSSSGAGAGVSGEKKHRLDAYYRHNNRSSKHATTDSFGRGGTFVPMQDFQRKQDCHGSPPGTDDEERILGNSIWKQTHMDVSWEPRAGQDGSSDSDVREGI